MRQLASIKEVKDILPIKDKDIRPGVQMLYNNIIELIPKESDGIVDGENVVKIAGLDNILKDIK